MADTKTEGSKIFVKTAFVFIGIGSLLSWNAIISCMDFFISFQKGYNPQVIFPNMNFVLNLMFQFFLLKVKKIASYKSQIIFAFLITSIILILLPFVVIYLNPMQSFYASCGLILISGLVNAVCSSAVFGLAVYLPIEFVPALGTGQAVAGIIANIIRYILLFFFSDSVEDLKKSGYIFFGTAAFIIIIAICFVIGIYKDAYFISLIENSDENAEYKPEEKQGLKELSINDDEKKDDISTQKEFSLITLMQYLFDINIMIFLSYVITFTLFPGATIKPQLFNLLIGWKINTIIFIFNVCDSISRNFISLCTPSKRLLYITGIGRMLLLFTFPGVCYAENHQLISPTYINIIVLLNTMLLSMTSGFCTSLCFALAPGSVPDEMKGKSGASVALSLISGIFIGTFGGMGMNKLTSL